MINGLKIRVLQDAPHRPLALCLACARLGSTASMHCASVVMRGIELMPRCAFETMLYLVRYISTHVHMWSFVPAWEELRLEYLDTQSKFGYDVSLRIYHDMMLLFSGILEIKWNLGKEEISISNLFTSPGIVFMVKFLWVSSLSNMLNIRVCSSV